MAEGLAAVILAGVHDWGGCALHRAAIRPLAPIANRPLLEHLLKLLVDVGVGEAVVCTNGRRAELQAAVEEMSLGDLRVDFHEDPMPRGPAGCVRDAGRAFGDRELLVVEGSVLPHFDVLELLRTHRRSGACLSIAARPVGHPSDPAHEPVGLYVFSAPALDYIAPTGFQDIKEGVIPKLHAAGLRVDAFAITGAAPRLSGIASYFAVNEWAVRSASRGGWALDGYERRGSTLVHVDAEVDPSVQLLGPVMVGPGAVVRRRSIVVGPTSIDREGLVSEEAVVSRSAVWSGAVVEAGAHLDRCIVARGARVAAHTRQFNTVCVPSGHGTFRGVGRSRRKLVCSPPPRRARRRRMMWQQS